ncbi:hypothetical protein CRI93_07285 [Longimonas halophila]|uniref:Uncharacterized protein n=1 Tax=Longimonas halophila TaxID=1469170 RepID=A0A2H3NMB7_9BACT|nr:tetratricopeptide repeat protein [Longimonas halophila]PEN07778.1 hypothetical protein CRI93_07285 [Longimonas halophila]
MSTWHWLTAGIGAILVAGVLSSCSPTSVVGSRVDNFRAFYNTFYNAEEDFARGMESVQAQSHALDPSRFASIFPDPSGGVDEAAFESAIDRSADVLREHPQSKWVDDALMLIGQSYFYTSEFGAAAEKFNEIIALGNERADEARFWLARTLVSQGDAERAAEHVRLSLERDDVQDPWRSQLWLVAAELRTEQATWPEALAALDNALQGDLDRREETRAQLLRGQIFEKRNDYAAAARAYRAATESREFEVALAGEMSALRAQAQTSTNPDLVERANLLSRNDRNLEQRDALRLLEAYLHVLQERPAEARQAYQELLHGEEPIGRDLQSRAYYQMAVMYRDVWRDYGRAAAYFDSSATTASRPDNQEQRGPAPPTTLPDVQDLAERYGAVAEQQERVARYDSLLALGSLPEEAFQQRIQEIAEAKREAEAEEANEREDTDADSNGFAQTTRRPGVQGQDERGPASTIAAEAANEETGFLFHRSPQRVQEGQRSFQQRWGTRPREPFWRIADITPDADQAQAPTVTDAGRIEATEGADVPSAEEDSPSGGAASDGESLVDVDAVPRTEAEQEAMRDERTWAWYELGNALFLNIGQPDSALVWYERVLVEAADHPVYERAVYARAEALEAAGQPNAADGQYESLIRANPDSPFADRARARLGRSVSPAPDSTQQAFEAYKEARSLVEEEQWRAGLDRLTEVARTYRADTVVAPRALWSMGQAYLSWHRRDSTAAQQALRRAIDTLNIDAADSDTATASSPEAAPRSAPAQQSGPPQVAPPDAAADTTQGIADDATRRAEAYPALRKLMQHLQTSFPDAPQSQRAARLAEALSGSEPTDSRESESESTPPGTRSAPERTLPTPRSSSEDDT